MDPLGDGPDDDGLDEPLRPPLHPDDRIWRHPSELLAHGPAGGPWPGTAAPAGALPAGRAGWRDRRAEPRTLPVALLGGAVGALLTAGLLSVGLGLGREPEVPTPITRVAAPASFVGEPLAGGTDVVGIAERTRPAIVQVQVRGGGQGTGSGSGVLFRSDGYIITNHHVVRGASSVRVVLASGRELRADLLGGDAETDVAVIKVDAHDLPSALLGTATRLKVGQPAIAIGSPLGLVGGPSVSVGVVSALGRTIEGDTGAPLLDMIQTDAPIAPGSSGGALVDSTGAVIGITTAIAVSDVGAEGLGFATPIDVARVVADQIVATGQVVHVWLGIEGEDLDGEAADQLGIDGGARVKVVVDGSPADRAGLREGDVIATVDGQAIPTMAALKVLLRQRPPGTAVELGVLRDGEARRVSAALGERPRRYDPER